MHEMALMTEMVNLLVTSAEENGIREITQVKLVVGKMSMANPGALELAFEVLKSEELFSRNVVLEIVEREILIRCGDCGQSFHSDVDYQFICPFCQSLRTEVLTGRELYVEHYHGEEL